MGKTPRSRRPTPRGEEREEQVSAGGSLVGGAQSGPAPPGSGLLKLHGAGGRHSVMEQM